MRTLILTVIMILVLSVPVMAEEWETTDTLLLTTRIIDWGQTRDIVTRQIDTVRLDGTYYHYQENNLILGSHPSITQVDLYFIALIGTDFLITKYANPTFKKWWNAIGIAIETYCITGNAQIGVKIKF
jgi:hypothetical protein